MVDIGGTCIDRTEVTEAQYQAFLAASPSTSGLPAACGFKNNANSFKPSSGPDCRWDPDANPNLPVACVDWCDAYAFCQWAGKRLCGKIGGGSVAYESGDSIDATKDQWFRACSKNGTLKYPYGSTLVPKTCKGSETGGKRVDVATITTCEGGFAGIFDMVGNVFEHEDSCKANVDGKDRCTYRGGSWFYSESGSYNNCGGVYQQAEATRDARFDDVGFRCCSQ